MDTYFNEVSFGQFRVSAGPNGIMSVTVPNRKSTYATDSSTKQDINMRQLFRDVVTQLNLNKIDLSRYDNDGAVDELMLVAAGIDSSSSNPVSRDQLNNRLHSANAPRRLYGSLARGTVKVDNVLWISEYMHSRTTRGVVSGIHPTTIGVAVHELLHTFGAPDLYDLNGGVRNDAGIGEWGIMGSGNWLPNIFAANRGSRPVHPSAFIKKKLGWVTPTRKITHGYGQANKAVQLLLSAFSGRLPGTTYECSSSPSSKEYFLMENRVRKGFDTLLPGEGLLVWHINESEKVNSSKTNQNDSRLVMLEQADGLWDLQKTKRTRTANSGDANDPFPTRRGANSFDLNSVPNSNFYNGKNSEFYLVNIADQPGKKVSMTYQCKSFNIFLFIPLLLLILFRRNWNRQ